MNEQEDDLDNDIRLALGDDAPGVEVTEVDPTNETPVELPDPPEGNDPTRERGPDGKFVAKSKEEAQDTPQVETETTESIRPPASWSPQAKADFKALPAHIQQEVLKREQDIDKGFRERASQLKRYEPLEEVIAPHRQKWAVAGVDEATAVKQLLAASDWLDRDPAAALAHLARQYGVNLPAQPQGQVHPQPASVSQAPEFTALQQELASLKQQIASQQDVGLQSQIEAFKNDPANLYFENVRDDMAVLLSSGKAGDMKEAYEMACWMRPDIRPLLQTAQVAAPNPADVARKRLAGGSVTGSPAAPKPKVSNGSIEDDIRAAVDELRGAA